MNAGEKDHHGKGADWQLDGQAGSDVVNLSTPVSLTGSLSVAADEINVFGDVATGGDQSFDGAVVLRGDVAFSSSAGGINFGETVNAANGLADLLIGEPVSRKRLP